MRKLFLKIFFVVGFFKFFFVPYSTLLHLPPLRFHCAEGCWDRTQDRCNWCIGNEKTYLKVVALEVGAHG
jgi:hypothetical protein